MRHLLIAAGISLVAPAFAAPAALDAEAAWRAEIERANRAYAVEPTAILKIDDAIYLKPGQTAWLVQGPRHPVWQLKQPAGPAPAVAFSADSRTAILTDERGQHDLLAEGGSVQELGPGRRISGGMAQTEPGRQGFRVAAYSDDNPRALAFKGLDYFPYDPSFVVTARFEATTPTPKIFQTSRGWYKQFYHIGDAIFTLQGVDTRLPFYAGSDKPGEIDSLAAFVMDDTTGTETYGVGRYIDVAVQPGALPSSLTIDFNNLYNPNCARSPHYNCPYAVDRLKLPLRAGERKPADHS